MSFSKTVSRNEVVWHGKPWITPVAITRTVTVIIILVLFVWLEIFVDVAYLGLLGIHVWLWTALLFGVIWLFSMVELIFIRASNSYVLMHDGLEIRRGIIRLHSFVVTPAGFGDLTVYQSLGGRVFGYGDITVNSQGERQAKLVLVRAPFSSAKIIREIMGKPVVRVENRF